MNIINNSYHGSRDAISTDIASLVVNMAIEVGTERNEDEDLKLVSPFTADLKTSPASVPIATFSDTYKNSMTIIAREVFEHDQQIAPNLGETDLMCISVINCGTLEEVIRRIIFFSQAMRKGNFSLTMKQDQALFAMSTGHKHHRANELLCDIFGLSFFYKFFSWLIGEPLHDAVIDLGHECFFDRRITTALLPCPVIYSRPDNVIRFDARTLSKPVVRTYQELMNTLAISPFELIALQSSTHLPLVVEGILTKALDEGADLPGLDRVAKALARSSATLRRHLASENTSYQEILDQCRKTKAVEFLMNTGLSVDDISNNLGFSATSSFSRAFKGWTGLCPSDFRERGSATVHSILLPRETQDTLIISNAR
jgi:AraC-like DNA-binding protein